MLCLRLVEEILAAHRLTSEPAFRGTAVRSSGVGFSVRAFPWGSSLCGTALPPLLRPVLNDSISAGFDARPVGRQVETVVARVRLAASLAF